MSFSFQRSNDFFPGGEMLKEKMGSFGDHPQKDFSMRNDLSVGKHTFEQEGALFSKEENCSLDTQALPNQTVDLSGREWLSYFDELHMHLRTIRSGVALSMSALALGGLLSCTPQMDPLNEPLLPLVPSSPVSATPVPRINPETKLPNAPALLPCRTDTGECAQLEAGLKNLLGKGEVIAKDVYERVKSAFGEVKETFTQEVGITVDPDKKLSGVVFLEDVPTSLIFSPAPKVGVPAGTTYTWTLTRLNTWSFSTGAVISTIQAERAQFTFTERKKHKVVLTITYPDGRVVSVSVHVLFIG